MADPKPLKDKVILITGAAQGHGEAVARYVAARGAIVSLSDITGDAVKATAQRIRGEYPESEALGHHVDVCNDDSVRNWVEGVKKQFGRINGCVNNAGTSLSSLIIATQSLTIIQALMVSPPLWASSVL